MDDFQSLVGRLLVAMPGSSDSRFEHAVILICAHRPDHAMGLRLDRPAPGVNLKKVLTKLETDAPEAAAERLVLIGGPVERERGFVLHTDDWLIDDASLAFALDELKLQPERDDAWRFVATLTQNLNRGAINSGRLTVCVEGMREGYVFEVHATGVRSGGASRPLAHPTAYYTVGRL